MSWVGPVVKGAAKYGVKYGPQAKILWDNGGKHVQQAAQDKLAAASARRTAFQKAETVVDGAVLKQIYAGKPVWVVFSGETPVDAFPTPSIDLPQLVEHADLSARTTPAEYHASQLRQRARRARGRLPLRNRAEGLPGKELDP